MYLIYSSPEIHPVSPRVTKRSNLCARIGDRMCSCCKREKNKNKIAVKVPVKAPPPAKKKEPMTSIFSRMCKWKRKPRPPPPKPTKATTESKTTFLSRLKCCKRPVKKPIKPQRLKPSQKSCWRTLFCLDKACCAKCNCKRNNESRPRVSQPPLEQQPSQDSKRIETKRSSSFVGLPKLEQSLVEHTSVMKGAIPVLPICLAWFCLILNVFLPGIGTIVSGFLCLCFGKPRFTTNDTAVARLGSLCVNTIVGISQIFTIIFCLVGWGWSIWWGVIMLKVARKNRRIKLAEKAAGGPPAPTPVVNQNHDLERGH